jgi:type IV pilus assembly protein PilA
MKNKSLAHGFTLIEVAIVIALMMLLAVFVFPAYSNYLKRAKVSEALSLASTAKIAVSHHVTDDVPLTSIWTPPTPTDAIMDMGIYLTDTTGISLSSFGVPTDMPARHSGEIVIVFSKKIAPAAHNELILSPRQADPTRFSSNGHELPLDLTHPLPNQSIIWECNSANPPAINRGTRGNLDSKLAPTNCRS